MKLNKKAETSLGVIITIMIILYLIVGLIFAMSTQDTQGETPFYQRVIFFPPFMLSEFTISIESSGDGTSSVSIDEGIKI